MKFEPVAWTLEAEAGLGASLGDDLSAIRDQVLVGDAALWHCKAARSWLVTRVEPTELVIVCYAGRGGRAMFRSMYQAAQRIGKTKIRFHTACPWIIDLVADWQPLPVEYVIRFPVKPAQE